MADLSTKPVRPAIDAESPVTFRENALNLLSSRPLSTEMEPCPCQMRVTWSPPPLRLKGGQGLNRQSWSAHERHLSLSFGHGAPTLLHTCEWRSLDLFSSSAFLQRLTIDLRDTTPPGDSARRLQDDVSPIKNCVPPNVRATRGVNVNSAAAEILCEGGREFCSNEKRVLWRKSRQSEWASIG